MLRLVPKKVPPDGRTEQDGTEALSRAPDALESLAQAASEGESSAQRTLIVTLLPKLLRTVRKVLGPGHPDIEDVTFQAAHAVLASLSSFRGQCTVLHFACRVAVLTAMNERRRSASQKRVFDRYHETEPDDVASTAKGPDARLHAKRCVHALRQSLDSLPPAIAEALALQAVLGHSASEIAEATGVPIDTVRSRLKIGRQALRRKVLVHPELREICGGRG